jgi:TPR repeat protein
VGKDNAEAVKWCLKAAEQGDTHKQFDLGLDYELGLDGFPQDYSEAAKWYRKAAEQGNADAQDFLGDAYSRGKGIGTNLVEAQNWWRKAAESYRKEAEKGDAKAQWRLGSMYASGEGVDTDKAEAVKWHIKAAEQGDAFKQFDLGLDYYEMGLDGFPENYAEAVKWWRKAAEQGNAVAQSMLGMLYERGQGVRQDFLEAIKWLQKAADQGVDHAQAEIIECYDGLGWSCYVKNEYGEAVKWYRKAAEEDDAAGQLMLGGFYHDGAGVRQDKAEARKWSLKAAEQYRTDAERGDADAQVNLAECYGNMDDKAEEVKWYRRAADQGNLAAQCNLGMAYSHGEGAPKNDIEAYKWLSLAAAQGFKEGAKQRDLLAQSMSRAEVVEAQSRAAVFGAHKEAGASNGSDGRDTVGAGNVPRATGTGFFVTGDGYLLTCYHVVQDGGRISVRTKEGTFAAKLVKSDKANDVALLKVAGKFPALPLGLSRGVKLGESVFTVGFPNIELQGFAPKLTKGEISSLTGMQDDPREFQISVAVQPGNSGGPLVNQYGNVVGIVAAQLEAIATLETTGSLPQNVNYAVKSSVLNVLLESLPEISAKLLEPNPIKDRKFEDVEKEAEGAVALVLVY